MNDTRRGFIGKLLGAPVAAVAAHFGVSRAFAADMQRQVADFAEKSRDFEEIEGWEAELAGRKPKIFVPGETFDEKRAIWYSVAGVAGVWTDRIIREVLPHVHGELDSARAARLRNQVHGMAERIARALDRDLQSAEVEAGDIKVIVETPLVRNVRHGLWTDGVIPSFEIAAGVRQETNIFGTTKTKVGYIPEEIQIARA